MLSVYCNSNLKYSARNVDNNIIRFDHQTLLFPVHKYKARLFNPPGLTREQFEEGMYTE